MQINNERLQEKPKYDKQDRWPCHSALGNLNIAKSVVWAQNLHGRAVTCAEERTSSICPPSVCSSGLQPGSLGARLFPRETLPIPVGTLWLSHPYKLGQDITEKEELQPKLPGALPPQLTARAVSEIAAAPRLALPSPVASASLMPDLVTKACLLKQILLSMGIENRF